MSNEINHAAAAVLREALDNVSVHPCDFSNDEVRAKGLCGPMARLYQALWHPSPANGAVGEMPELPPADWVYIDASEKEPRVLCYNAMQMQAYARAAVLAERASGPNAALVAALHELALLMSDTIRGEYEPDSFTLQPAVHALATVGIEFPDDDYLLTKRELCAVVPAKPSAAMLKAMAESRAVDDEGEFPAMLDLLEFGGGNETRTVLEAAYIAALAAVGEGV